MFQSSFEGDVSTKGAVIVGSSGTGKTKLITHLALHSTIAQQLFVEIADLRKGNCCEFALALNLKR